MVFINILCLQDTVTAVMHKRVQVLKDISNKSVPVVVIKISD